MIAQSASRFTSTAPLGDRSARKALGAVESSASLAQHFAAPDVAYVVFRGDSIARDVAHARQADVAGRSRLPGRSGQRASGFSSP